MNQLDKLFGFNLQSKEAKSTLFYFLTSIVQASIGVFTLPIYTKYLSPTEFGIWALVIAINNFLLPIFQLGLNSYYIKEYYGSNDSEKLLFSSVFLFTLVWSTFLIIIGFLLGDYVYNLASIGFDFYPFMAIILVSNLSVCCFTYIPLKLRILGRAKNYALLLISKSVAITIVSIILVVLYKQSLLGRVNGFLIGNFMFIFFCIPYLYKNMTFQIDFSLIGKALRICLPLVPAVLATLLFDTIDRIVIEKYRPLAEVGYYSIGMQYSGLLLMTFTSFYKTIEPHIFKWSKQGEFNKIKNLLNKISILLALGGVSAILLVSPVLSLLIDNKFHSAIPIARLLILVVYMQSMYLLLATYNVSLFRNKHIMSISVSGLILFSALSFHITPIYGVYGIAILKSIIYGVMTIVLWISGVNRSKFLMFIGLNLLFYICLCALAFL